MNSREQADHDERLDAEPRQSCAVCTGDEDADPCSEECQTIFDRCRAEYMIRRHYAAAWSALRFARAYAFAASLEDYRVKAIMRRVSHIRVDIAELRKKAA